MPDAIEGIQALTHPILMEKKLAALLAQFPFSFRFTDSNLAYLLTLRDAFGDFPFFVEFRHNSWANEGLFHSLEQEDIGIVFPDVPSGLGLFRLNELTSHNNIAYCRFHSRCKEKWWGNNNKSRYDYNYSNDELLGIKKIVKTKEVTHKFLFFNNCSGGKAAKNAMAMKPLMGLKDSENRPILFRK